MRVVPKPEAQSPAGWLAPSLSVTVLAIRWTPSVGAQYLLWSEKQKSVALFPTTDFAIADNHISPLWIVKSDLRGNLEFAPAQWLVNGFWEDYYESGSAAVRVFEDVLKQLECRCE